MTIRGAKHSKGRPWTRYIAKIVLVSALLMATAGNGLAQEASTVAPGARVRVSLRRDTQTYLTRERIIGSLVSVQRDTIVVSERAGRPDLALPIEWARSLEVSRGRKSSAGKGALIGLLSGAAAGVTTALVVCADGECESGGVHLKGFVSTVFGLGGGLFGAGVGALVGGRFHGDRWEKVSIKDLRVGMNPSGGAGLRVSIAFR